MKKTLLLVCCFIVSISTYAQEWSVGPRIGMNMSNQFNSYFTVDKKSNSLEDAGRYTPGLKFGAFVEYKHKDFAVEADLLYSMEGAKVLDMVKRTHNLLIPIKAKYYITHGLNVYAGPQFGVQLSGPNSLTNKTSFAVVGGVGYKFKFGMDISAGYSYEIASQYKRYGMRNSVFNVSMGWNLFNRHL